MKFSLKTRWYVTGMLLALATFSLVFVSGCSKNAVAPIVDQPGKEYLEFFNIDDITPTGVDKASTLLNQDTLLTWAVGPRGGSLKFTSDGDKFAFTLPMDALATDLVITIRATRTLTPAGPFWTLDCGPNGTVFGKPLELVVKDKKDQPYSVLYYFNESKGAWEVQQVHKSGILLINHFSKYGISR